MNDSEVSGTSVLSVGNLFSHKKMQGKRNERKSKFFMVMTGLG
jgi:hypothetical protein